jgi:ergothioneine biosynthesis protein EgtB
MLNAQVRRKLQAELAIARARTDGLFQLIKPDALYNRPIPERHRIAFYLGHLEAFDWNMICVSLFDMKSAQPEFDKLFAFGIDPTRGNLPDDQPTVWPKQPAIAQYNANVREAVDLCLDRVTEAHRFEVAIEHRLMHAETLTYMLHRLPNSMKHATASISETDSRPVRYRPALIPQGNVTLGTSRNNGFAWDNEFDSHQIHVPEFAIDKYKVTNDDYLKFVRAGAYQEKSLWSERAWDWIRANDIQHPQFWKRNNGGFLCRTFAAEIPLPLQWPVYVSHAEADAYAKWKGKSLPSEAQFHRAAFAGPDGSERSFPWGEQEPASQHGNFDFRNWDPVRVDAHPEGDSAFGVAGLVGNGWEWTSTPFAPFEGFKPFEFYPGYSADFFDGNHYVMKGGSARTASRLLRRSFRNFFQPLYQNTYAGFRCVE